MSFSLWAWRPCRPIREASDYARVDPGSGWGLRPPFGKLTTSLFDVLWQNVVPAIVSGQCLKRTEKDSEVRLSLWDEWGLLQRWRLRSLSPLTLSLICGALVICGGPERLHCLHTRKTATVISRLQMPSIVPCPCSIFNGWKYPNL